MSSHDRPSLKYLLRPPAAPTRYFTEAGGKSAFRSELFDQEAQEKAESLANERINNTQLRRFFAPVVRIRLRAEAGEINDDDIRAELALLKARVAYAYERPGSQVPAVLVSFITNHAFSVRTKRDFIAFARHFEAVVGFHRGFAK